MSESEVTLLSTRAGSQPAPAPAPAAGAGERYVIAGQVAQGGMGAILEARETAIQRRVAMKVMLEGASAEDRERFLAEARITGQLEHPNIVPVHELGTNEAAQAFYTMKFVGGSTLRQVLEELAAGQPGAAARYALPALLTVFQKVCDAVAFAHSRRIIHRDLKPENIMLGEFGEVLLMDWGLAKVLGSAEVPSGEGQPPPEDLSASATMAGTVMGTPQYMAPEQARGEVETMDERADIYALGAILYHLLALRAPVSGSEAWSVVRKVASGKLEPLTAPKTGQPSHLLGGQVPASLVAVVSKATALAPGQRYQSVAELQADLTAYQNGFATSAEEKTAWKQLRLLVRRHQAASAGILAVLLVGTTLGTKAVLEGKRAEREGLRATAEGARAKAEGERATAALADLRRQAPALRQLAESEENAQRLESALEKLDGALALEPEDLGSYWKRAWLLIGLERFGQAAEAMELAISKDPAQASLGRVLPLLKELTGTPESRPQLKSEQGATLLAYLRENGGMAEIARLSSRLQMGPKEQFALVRQRVESWLGRGKGNIDLDEAGRIVVKLNRVAVENLDPLRGLPIQVLQMDVGTRVTSLEPLRGMPLQEFRSLGLIASDLSPLHGMPLRSLSLENANVERLDSLVGLPLEELRLPNTKIVSLAPLAGMRLRKLNLNSTQVVDFSPLQGMPLEDFTMNWMGSLRRELTPLSGAPLQVVYLEGTSVKNLLFLAQAPVKLLVVNGAGGDLSPLRHKPLQRLTMLNCQTRDLSPLNGAPIESITLTSSLRLDLAPLKTMPRLERVSLARKSPADREQEVEVLRDHPTLKYIETESVTGYQAVAEFWAEWDKAHPKAR